MSTSFSDLNKGRNLLLHRWSVWQEVARHLSKFIDTDAEPTRLGITTRGEGVTVPQDVILEIIEQVQSTIDSTMLEISDIEQTIMLEDRNVRAKSATGKEEAQGSKAKRVGKAKDHVKDTEGEPD